MSVWWDIMDLASIISRFFAKTMLQDTVHCMEALYLAACRSTIYACLLMSLLYVQAMVNKVVGRPAMPDFYYNQMPEQVIPFTGCSARSPSLS